MDIQTRFNVTVTARAMKDDLSGLWMPAVEIRFGENNPPTTIAYSIFRSQDEAMQLAIAFAEAEAHQMEVSLGEEMARMWEHLKSMPKLSSPEWSGWNGDSGVSTDENGSVYATQDGGNVWNYVGLGKRQ